MKFFVLFTFGLLFPILGVSKTLIVSDIDDTIKASHVRDTKDKISNAFVTTIAFKGMAEVYQELINEGAEVSYVTNAPEFLMKKSHSSFIQKNFPAGKIHFRNGSDKTHKYNAIKNLLKDPAITRVILIGDNGEADIQHYEKIERDFGAKVDISTYIRIVYSTPDKILSLGENQIGFVTPIEVLQSLALREFIHYDRYLSLAEKLAQEILEAERVDTKDTQYFPFWLNCSGFEPYSPSSLTTEIIAKSLQKVSEICNQTVQIELNAY